MAVNLLQTADFLRDELQAYYRVLRQGGGGGRQAAERLRGALLRVEPLIPPGSPEQVDAALEQRWGYVQLMSLIGTAKYELQRHQP